MITKEIIALVLAGNSVTYSLDPVGRAIRIEVKNATKTAGFVSLVPCRDLESGNSDLLAYETEVIARKMANLQADSSQPSERRVSGTGSAIRQGH